jgi:hypothetical protein
MARPGDSEAGQPRDVLDAALKNPLSRILGASMFGGDFLKSISAMESTMSNAAMAAFDPPGNPFSIQS